MVHPLLRHLRPQHLDLDHLRGHRDQERQYRTVARHPNPSALAHEADPDPCLDPPTPFALTLRISSLALLPTLACQVFFTTFLFALANGPGNVASFYLIEVLGRKRLLAYSMLLAAVSAFIFASASGKHDQVAVAFACAFQSFSVSGWNSLDALSTESFPTSVRTTGMGILSASGRFASLVAMIINGSLETNVFLLLSVTGAFTVLGSIFSFFLPYEPTGLSLDGMPIETDPYRGVKVELEIDNGV